MLLKASQLTGNTRKGVGGGGAKENTRGRAVLDCKSIPGPTLLNENALHLDTKISMSVKTLFMWKVLHQNLL